tara:strand:- start:622 stop:1050 length:429 start_codon:yes stop_codon:yes gene_type:complete
MDNDMNHNMYTQYEMEHSDQIEYSGEINNPPQTVQNTLLPIIGFIIFISFCSSLYGICNCRNDPSDRSNTENINTQLITNINKHVSKYEKNKGDEYCSICLDEFNKNDHIITLECKHYYHQLCITNWLKKEVTCPLCRKIFI